MYSRQLPAINKFDLIAFHSKKFSFACCILFEWKFFTESLFGVQTKDELLLRPFSEKQQFILLLRKLRRIDTDKIERAWWPLHWRCSTRKSSSKFRTNLRLKRFADHSVGMWSQKSVITVEETLLLGSLGLWLVAHCSSTHHYRRAVYYRFDLFGEWTERPFDALSEFHSIRLLRT